MSQRAKQWKLSTQTCPRMSKVAHGRVLVSQNGAESYRGQSWSLVVVSRFSWLVSRLNRCGQSSWSVVLHGQSLFRVRNEGPVWWRHESVLEQLIDHYYGEKFDIGLNKKIKLTISGRCSGSWCWCVWCRKIALKAVFGFLLCWNSRGGVGYWNTQNYQRITMNCY